MVLDAESSAWIGVISSITAGVGSYFVQREKVKRLESDVHDLTKKCEKFITFNHFESTIGHLRHTLDGMQSDIKVILRKLLQ